MDDKKRGGAGRGQGRKPIAKDDELMRARPVRMTDEEWAKCKRLGGAAWVRRRSRLPVKHNADSHLKENGMQRWTPIAGCVGQAEGTHVTWADHCAEIERLKQVRCEGCGYLVSEREHLGCKSEKTLKDLERLTTERDNAEKREYEVLGRANALEAELKATQARLVASDRKAARRDDGGASVLTAGLELLRDRWCEQAFGIERTHGEDDPAAKALRACIGDLHGCIRADEF